MTRADVIRRIEALLNKEGKGATEPEAQNAVAMAQRLMALHSITMAELHARGQDDGIYGEQKAVTLPTLPFHYKAIIPVIERAFPVKVIVRSEHALSPATGRMNLVAEHLNLFGEVAAVVTAEWSVKYLAGVYASLWTDYRERTGAGRLAREPFFIGLSDGMLKRFDVADAELRAELPRARGALVLVRDKLQQKLEAYDPSVLQIRRPTAYNTSHADGVIEGERIPLNRPLDERGPSKQIGG